MCGIVENNPNDAFVIKATDLDEIKITDVPNIVIANTETIIINDGENGGLTITPKLVEELQKMTARIDGIINALQNAVPATGTPDSGAALILSIKTALETIVQKEDFSRIENEKIKH